MLEADLAATEHHHHHHPNINNINYPERLKAEVFMWVLRVPERYIDLLDQHNPIALIILAHYAALLCTDVNSLIQRHDRGTFVSGMDPNAGR